MIVPYHCRGTSSSFHTELINVWTPGCTLSVLLEPILPKCDQYVVIYIFIFVVAISTLDAYQCLLVPTHTLRSSFVWLSYSNVLRQCSKTWNCCSPGSNWKWSIWHTAVLVAIPIGSIKLQTYHLIEKKYFYKKSLRFVGSNSQKWLHSMLSHCL
jgi:hypothetical protein